MIKPIDFNKRFCVYVHTNKINGKKYVGVTSQKPEKRWDGGKGYTERQPHMYNAIQKYGWENFDHEVLFNDLSAEEAGDIEQRLIEEWMLQDPAYGYNIQGGGLVNSSLPIEVRKKISDAHKGRPKSEEHRKHLSESKRGQPMPEGALEKAIAANTGKPLSDEHKEKLSKALTGKVRSKEHCANISKAKRGKPLSDAQKIALMIVHENNNGRKHTEESKAKISAGNKGKTFSDETKNKMSDSAKKRGPNKCIKVAQCEIDSGEIIKIWDSAAEASRVTGIDNSRILKCAKRQSGIKSAGGFDWKIIED